MDRAERIGLGLAIVGHLLLFGMLSIGLALHRPVIHAAADPMDVALVGPIGLRSSLPDPSREPPAESQAPEQGLVEEADAASARDMAKPAPDVVPQPSAVPPPKRERLASDFLKDLGATAAKEKKAKGKRLGDDFLKGITADTTGGKGSAPRAALTGPQMAGLAGAIAAQVRPCYVVPTGGTDAASIVTVLRLRFNRDGSIDGTPTVVDHSGITPANQRYLSQMDSAARRAVLRCAPLKLPANLYEGGWEDIEFVFNPRTME